MEPVKAAWSMKPKLYVPASGDEGQYAALEKAIDTDILTGLVLKVGSEDRRRQRRLNSVKEGRLLLWADLVDAAEGKTHEAIGGRLGSEACRYLRCCLDGLARSSQAADSHGV